MTSLPTLCAFSFLYLADSNNQFPPFTLYRIGDSVSELGYGMLEGHLLLIFLLIFPVFI